MSSVGLKVYLDRELARLEQLMLARMEAQDKALTKAEATLRDRFAGVNEFREALADLTAQFETRAVLEARFKAMQEKIEALQEGLSAIRNRQENLDGRIIGYSAGVGVVVLIISIVSQLLNLGGP